MLMLAFGGIAACGPSTGSSASPSSSTTATSSSPALPAASGTPTGCALTSSLGGPNSYAGHTVETIILTADHDVARAATANAVGVVFLQKPANAQRIRRTVMELIHRPANAEPQAVSSE